MRPARFPSPNREATHPSASRAPTQSAHSEDAANDGACLSPEHEANGYLVAGERADGGDGCLVDLLAAAGRDELDACGPERKLTSSRPFLLTNQAGHARDDEQEQERRGRD